MDKCKLFKIILCFLIFIHIPTLYLYAQNKGETSLLINEIMASNGDTILDEYGESGDWIEIFNASEKAIDIAGFYISDEQDEPLKYRIPEGYPEKTTILPGGYLLLWADDKPERGPLHLGFKLSKEGEGVFLTTSDKSSIIDEVVFGKQRRDVSYGRKFKDRDEWAFFTEPTPGLPNRGLGLPSYKIAGFYLFYKENRAEIFIITGLTLVMILLIVMLLWMAIKLKEEKIKHKTLIDAVPEVIMQLDREGKCVWINELGTKFFGEGINGCHINNFLVNSSDREKVREAFESLFEGNEKVIISETLVKGKSGQIRLLKWCFVKLKMNNKVCQVIATARDITEKRKKKIQLKTNEKRYRDLFENSPVGLLKCDSKGNIIDINKHMLEILGSPDKKETLKFNLLTLPNLKESGISGHLEKVFKENVIIENERKYTSMWGKEIWLYYKIYPVTDEKGSVIEAVAACIDITERRKAEEKINYLSFHDSLTGLYNRAYFREELKRLDTKRQLPISIIMGDANGLKLVNDAFGHYEGDKLLKKLLIF